MCLILCWSARPHPTCRPPSRTGGTAGRSGACCGAAWRTRCTWLRPMRMLPARTPRCAHTAGPAPVAAHLAGACGKHSCRSCSVWYADRAHCPSDHASCGRLHCAVQQKYWWAVRWMRTTVQFALQEASENRGSQGVAYTASKALSLSPRRCWLAGLDSNRLRPNTVDWLHNLTTSIGRRYSSEASAAAAAGASGAQQRPPPQTFDELTARVAQEEAGVLAGTASWQLMLMASGGEGSEGIWRFIPSSCAHGNGSPGLQGPCSQACHGPTPCRRGVGCSPGHRHGLRLPRSAAERGARARAGGRCRRACGTAMPAGGCERAHCRRPGGLGAGKAVPDCRHGRRRRGGPHHVLDGGYCAGASLACAVPFAAPARSASDERLSGQGARCSAARAPATQPVAGR